MGRKVNVEHGKQGFQPTDHSAGKTAPSPAYRGPDAGLSEAAAAVAPSYAHAYDAFTRRPAQPADSLAEWAIVMRTAGDSRLNGTMTRADHAVLTLQADEWLRAHNHSWEDLEATHARIPAPPDEEAEEADEPEPPTVATTPGYPERRGAKWTPGFRPASDIARDIRNDLKQARKDGTLPRDVQMSVRIKNYSGGRSINVTLSGWPKERIWTNETDAYGLPMQRETEEAQAVRKTIEGIREAYNRDASDPMVDYFDVDYYGSTNWDWRLS